MKRITLTICLALFAIIANAQEKKESNLSIDPLDISTQLEKIDAYGVPTIALVNEMKAKADTLYNQNNWKDAAIAYEEYAKKANWLANLLSQCVEPYYSASYDDKKNISYSRIQNFIPYESQANKLKDERNVAYVKIGLCYKQLGDISKAVAFLHKGLDLLDVNQSVYWTMAAKAMAEIVGFEPQSK